MNSPKARRIAISVFAVLLLVFVCYQAFGVQRSDVRTETAMYGTTWDALEVSAVAIRSETLLTEETDGAIRYLVPDGGHIANGGVLAEVYASDSDVAKWEEIASLEKEIEQLRQLNQPTETYQLDPGKLDEKIDAALIRVVNGICKRDWSVLDEDQDQFLHLINQKGIVTGKAEGYGSRITELEEEVASLRASTASAVKQIIAPSAGCFVSRADGYEGAYDYKSAETLTAEQLQTEPVKADLPQGTIGKIYDQFNWYLAFTVNAEDAVKFKSILESYPNRVYLSLPFVSEERVPAEVAAVNQASFDSDAAVILKCSYLQGSLLSIRSQQVEVQLDAYSGVMVPQSAIHFADVEEVVTDADGNETTKLHKNVRGVYRVNGAALEFVQIFSDATVNGYVICRTDLRENEELYTQNTIALYDEVVVEGKDLYDGRPVA